MWAMSSLNNFMLISSDFSKTMYQSVPKPCKQNDFLFFLTYHTNAQASPSSNMRCWPQFVTLVADVIPTDLNAEATFSNCSFWNTSQLSFLLTNNKPSFKVTFFSVAILIQNQNPLGLLSILIYATEPNWNLIACIMQCTYVNASTCIMFVHSLIQVEDSDKYDVGLRMSARVLCVSLVLFQWFGLYEGKASSDICWQKSLRWYYIQNNGKECVKGRVVPHENEDGRMAQGVILTINDAPVFCSVYVFFFLHLSPAASTQSQLFRILPHNHQFKIHDLNN